jgi:predicted transcriptional regulator of viral defense system
MITDLEHFGNIPVSTSAVASLFSELKAGNQKVRNLELAGKIIRLKKGLYVVDPQVSRIPLSTELIANHLYAPSYVSMQTALRYYGLIPEAVYTTQSMTLKHSRNFDTPLGRFQYQMISREAFAVGITYINKQNYSFLIATPEKALCDLIANSPQVNLRYLKDVETFLEEDIRMDMEEVKKMNLTLFQNYAQVGKKASSIETLIKYLKK